MRSDLPYARDVVLVGGGHTHALLLKRWGMRPVPGARLTVINPAPTAPYTGMLPGHIAGHYARDDLEIDLVRLSRFADARLIFGRVDGLDPLGKTVTVPGRPPIRYDLCSLNIGITSDMPSLPGFAEHGVPAKPLGPFAARWRAYLDAPGPIVVIGGGVAGVELAMAMRHRLADDDIPITVIERDEALAGVGPRARQRLRTTLGAHRITVREGAVAKRIERDAVVLDSGEVLQSTFTLGAAGARSQDWLTETGLELTDGYITVGADLRSRSHPSVYAAGDCAHLAHAPRPKAGVFAVRAAPVLTANLSADLTGGARRNFRPQRDYLKLVSLGGKSALADKWGLAPSGPWVWRWKDRIDRRFMDKLADLTPMSPPPLPRDAARGLAEVLGPKPLCGGCGAKVASGPLETALMTASLGSHPDVEVVAGDDAAVLRMGDVRQALTTDHLRAFWPDPLVAAEIAALHALSDVRAMGAAPQAMLAQITLPRLSDAMQAAWLDEILAGAGRIARAAGAQIVGGHTSVGAELTLGFTVTGRLEGVARTMSGVQPGQLILLTRPLGTGVILAGEMALQAKGREVKACLDQMRRVVDDSAALTSATAMTDVTGFGLAGHLARLCAASGTGADLWLNEVPFLDGAERLAAAGVRSTLYDANRAQVPEWADDRDVRVDLLFDPQTAGGLLATLAEEDAEAAVDALRERGTEARLIGRVTEAGPLRLIR